MTAAKAVSEREYKACCTSFYENEAVAGLLGEDFHPGGAELTLHMGDRLGLKTDSEVLDIACGKGASAIRLIEAFGCRVTGIDLSAMNLEKARAAAEQAGCADRADFIVGDAESLPVSDRHFDAVISECSVCTFLDADTAAAEMARVLRPGGQLAVSDVVVDGEIPPDLRDMMLRFACVAGARPVGGYRDLFTGAGFMDVEYEDHTYTLEGLLARFRRMFLAWRGIEGLLKIDPAAAIGVTMEQVEAGLERAKAELAAGRFKYGVFFGALESERTE